MIIKPCKPAEINFYGSCAAHRDFAEYIPTYIGTLSLSSDTHPAQAAAALVQSKEAQAQIHGPNGVSEAINIDNAWTPSNGGKISTNCALVMENVADGYKKPNILDVKLGARLWADDAPPAKRAKLDKVAGETTSKPLGFRVAGMRIWQGADAQRGKDVSLDGYKFYDKDYGRSLISDNIVEAFEDYLCVARGTRPLRNTRRLIRRFIEDLQGIQYVLENEESRMYSASLLFVYEGDPAILQEAFTTEVQMLDSMEAQAKSFSGRDGAPKVDEDRRIGNGTSSGRNGTAAPVKGNKVEAPDSADTASTLVDGDTPEREIPLPHIQTVKLIDFAHAAWTPGQGRDENLLHGIRNVIQKLSELIV